MLLADHLENVAVLAYEGAKKAKGTRDFNSVTTVINRGVKRVGVGQLVVQSTHTYLAAMKEHIETGYQDEYHACLIFEEAKTACGGFDDLKNAVYENRITTAGDSPRWEELTYYIKRSAVGSKEEAKKTVKSEKTKEIPQES